MSIYFRKTFQRAFGTYPLKGERLLAAVTAAVDVGYRAFDTAQMYGNEAETGEALANAGVPRDFLCITTKVEQGNFSERAFLPSVEQSLKKLRVDQVDVLLLHWPPANGQIAPSVRLLLQAKKRGLARHIGVSNYTPRMMKEAAELSDEPLVANQVEFHPLVDRTSLLAAAIDTGIPLTAYCSVARGKVFEYPLFDEIGTTYEKTATQVVHRWILQKGVPATTMSSKPANMRSNFDVMGFTLSNIDMDRIDRLSRVKFRIVNWN